MRVVVKWLGDHPARLHEDAIKLVLNAIKEGPLARTIELSFPLLSTWNATPQ